MRAHGRRGRHACGSAANVRQPPGSSGEADLWALPSGADSAACDAYGGLDAVGDEWVLLCAASPGVIATPADLAVIRHRAPRAVPAASLMLEAELRDAGLQLRDVGARLADR